METRKGDYEHKRGPKFRLYKNKYENRFEVEKCNEWLKAFKPIRWRVDRLISSFTAFVYLALIIILVR